MTTIQNIMSFEDVVRNMEAHGMKIPPQREYIKIPHANMILKNAMDYFLSLEGRKCIWLPEYDKVSDWLTDNQGNFHVRELRTRQDHSFPLCHTRYIVKI